MVAFIIGAGMASVAGILYGMRIGKIDPLLGFIPLLKAFVATVIGGFGSIPGAVLGAYVLGFLEILLAGSLPSGFTAYRDAIIFALLIVVLKSLALWKHEDSYERAARFWARIFAINFAMGVVTGIPMEFQFGTNWAAFSKSAGGIIGQTLAMEGVFSFFLESSFLGLFLYGEKRLGPGLHWDRPAL